MVRVFFSYKMIKDYIIVGSSKEDHNATGLDSLTNAGSAYIFKNNVFKLKTIIIKNVKNKYI